MATRQEDLELDFTQDESEEASALAQQEAREREDDDPGDVPTEEDYDSDEDEEPTFREIHEQYDRLAEKGEDEPLADLYKDRFVGLYNLSGDKRRYLHSNLKGSLRALDEATKMLDNWVALGKDGDNSDYRGEFEMKLGILDEIEDTLKDFSTKPRDKPHPPPPGGKSLHQEFGRDYLGLAKAFVKEFDFFSEEVAFLDYKGFMEYKKFPGHGTLYDKYHGSTAEDTPAGKLSLWEYYNLVKKAKTQKEAEDLVGSSVDDIDLFQVLHARMIEFQKKWVKENTKKLPPYAAYRAKEFSPKGSATRDEISSFFDTHALNKQDLQEKLHSRFGFMNKVYYIGRAYRKVVDWSPAHKSAFDKVNAKLIRRKEFPRILVLYDKLGKPQIDSDLLKILKDKKLYMKLVDILTMFENQWWDADKAQPQPYGELDALFNEILDNEGDGAKVPKNYRLGDRLPWGLPPEKQEESVGPAPRQYRTGKIKSYRYTRPVDKSAVPQYVTDDTQFLIKKGKIKANWVRKWRNAKNTRWHWLSLQHDDEHRGNKNTDPQKIYKPYQGKHDEIFEYQPEMEHGMKYEPAKQRDIREKMRKPANAPFSPFATDLVNFIFSSDTARVINNENPSGAAENAMIKKFYTMWYKYFPDGVITPADWTEERWDWFSEGHERGRLNQLEERLFRFSATQAYKQIKVPSEEHIHKLDRADALQRMLRYAQDREKYAAFLRTKLGGKQAKKKPPPPPSGRSQKDDIIQLVKNAEDWFQTTFRNTTIGKKVSHPGMVKEIAEKGVRRGDPHYQIVQSISQELGLEDPDIGIQLLEEMTSRSEKSLRRLTQDEPRLVDEWVDNIEHMFRNYMTDFLDHVLKSMMIGEFTNDAGEQEAKQDWPLFLKEFFAKAKERGKKAPATPPGKPNLRQEEEKRNQTQSRDAINARLKEAKVLDLNSDIASIKQDIQHAKDMGHGENFAELSDKLESMTRELNRLRGRKGRKEWREKTVSRSKKSSFIAPELRQGFPGERAVRYIAPELRQDEEFPPQTELGKASDKLRQFEQKKRVGALGYMAPHDLRAHEDELRRDVLRLQDEGPPRSSTPDRRISGIKREDRLLGRVYLDSPPRLPSTRRQARRPASPPQVRMPFRERPLQRADLEQQDQALVALRGNHRFENHMAGHFQYDAMANHGRGAYRARRRPHYSIEPIIQPMAGAYQLQALISHEIAHVRPLLRQIETFERPADTYDIARKFNAESKRSRPLDGRAISYLQIGPWIRLRLLKSTVHITRKGTPPFKAYIILGKHLLEQVRVASKPRIVLPVGKKMQTLATTERLNNIEINDLAKICQKGLRKKGRHIIYRQSSQGGPLFDSAKNEEAIY